MRNLTSLLLLTLSTTAAASPAFTWQGRLVSSDGTPLNGEQPVRLTLTTEGGTELWTQEWTTTLHNGYAALDVSGSDENGTALDAGWFTQPVHLQITVDDVDLGDPLALGTVPRATAVVGSVRLDGSPGCTSEDAGTLRYQTGRVELCVGTGWVALGASGGGSASGDGSSALTAARSCEDIAGTGIVDRWIDPDGNGAGFDAFQVQCDLDGGWTRIFAMSNGGSNQLTGADRSTFWDVGANLTTTLATSTFSGLPGGTYGFAGWRRLHPLMQGTNQVRVKGTNHLGDSVDELYVVHDMAPDTIDGTTNRGAMSPSGQWTAAELGDTNTRNGWGACGTGTTTNNHVGLALCVDGLNNNVPAGREVQLWHYGGFTECFNVSFGNPSTGQNYTHSCGRGGYAIELWVRSAH